MPGNPDGKPAFDLSVLNQGWKENMLEAAVDGASMAELRVIAGLRTTTFYEMVKREPEFAEVVEQCRDLMESWYEKIGRDLITGRVQGNATAWVFSMKNKFQWRDKTEIDHRTPDGINVRHTLDDFYAKPGA